MIKLYAPAEKWGFLNASPFCMKLELYLIHNKVEYEKITNFDISKAPRWKIPYITDGDEILTDSSLIIDYIDEKYKLDMDRHLDDAQKSISHFILKTLEDSLYWCMVSERWWVDKNWKITKEAFFGGMPKFLYLIIPNIVRKNILRNLQWQWTGKRERWEIQDLWIKDIEMIVDFLWKKKFIFWESISFIDLAVYSTLVNLMKMPHESRLKDHINDNKNLVKYMKNMQNIFK